jgi:hypothetical protein
VLLTDPLNCSVDSLSDQFLASAVDAAHKAGDVSSFSFQLSLSLSLSPITFDSLSILSFQVIRKGFYQTKHVEHKGSVCTFPFSSTFFLNPTFFSCSILFNIIAIGFNFTYCHCFLSLWFWSHFSNLLIIKLT